MSSELLDAPFPTAWTSRPLRSMFRRSKNTGHPEEQMLSVYRDHGVVLKDGRTDNFNKTAENRNIYQLVDSGWLIVNRMKAWQGSLGISSHRGIVSGHYICFSPNHSEEPRYLNYLLRSAPYTAALRRASRGVRPSQIEIDNDLLGSLPVRLPAGADQRRIADYLDGEVARIDELISAKQEMRSLLIARKDSVMLDAVTGRLTESGERRLSTLPWADDLPSEWPEVLLRLVASTGSGHTPSRDRPEWWIDCTIPWITTGEVAQVRSDERVEITETREQISELGLQNSSATVHPAGTVVLCRTASAGYSAIMGVDMATSQDFATWTCGPRLRPRFLLLCLRAMRRDLLGRLATGSTHQTIYMPDLHGLRVPLPPLEVQDRVVESCFRLLDGVFESVRVLDEQIDLLRERRRSLITAVVTGEMEVP